MYLLQNVRKNSFRSEVWSYYRALPGQDSVAKIQPYVFHIKGNQKTAIHIPAYDQITQSRWVWSGTNLYGILRNRGYSSVALVRANTQSGKVDTLFYQTSDTYIDPLNNDYKFLPKTHELIWTSERSRWNQIYLYNLKTGKVKNRVTHGKYVVRKLVNVDAENRIIYFTAGGSISGQDPYYLHFYRVNFDGSDLKLLTPENATHHVSLSSNHKYFVDRYSRVNKKPVTILRSSKDGSALMTLEKADIKDLQATGWRYPQPFKLKARDDSTEIYGMIYFPVHFNPHKNHPLIDYIYAGPQAVITPKSFMRGLRDGSGNQALAALGFIVITVDGLGTAERSKKFQDFSYKNLGDAGIPDHVKAIKYLADKYFWIDTTLVGIWGHSAGGYDAARAMFKRPDFYKVGVSESGDHDFRVEKDWWPELYMGYPGSFPAEGAYAKQSNINSKLVSHLKGYLLLVHGGMDTNVHPAETYRLSEVLIKAGKSFDELIIPDVHHSYGGASSYATKRRWNYFIEHLMGAQPIRNFMIESNHQEGNKPISNFKINRYF
jgi:dipeptidyl aminopeptidase/acylaminoacyl peptidase